MDADQLLREALLLPADDRAKLAGELISSLDESPVEADREFEWAREIRRRLDEYDAGAVRAIPADDFLSRLKATVSARRP